MSHGPVVAAAAGDMLPATTPPATATAALHSAIACRARRSRDPTVIMSLPFVGCQRAKKSWLVPAAFLHGHWSSCWPVLLPAPNTSRHSPLLRFWNSKDPSDCAKGCHRLPAAPL